MYYNLEYASVLARRVYSRNPTQVIGCHTMLNQSMLSDSFKSNAMIPFIKLTIVE